MKRELDNYVKVRFILTMRNVNEHHRGNSSPHMNSFILTMRNVNEGLKNALIQLKEVLY